MPRVRSNGPAPPPPGERQSGAKVLQFERPADAPPPGDDGGRDGWATHPSVQTSDDSATSGPPAVPDDPTPPAVPPSPHMEAGIAVPTPTERQLGVAHFFISKATFNRDNELQLVINLPRAWRDVGLTLLDKQDRMLQAEFTVPEPRSHRTKTDEEIAEWYQEQFGTTDGSNNGYRG